MLNSRSKSLRLLTSMALPMALATSARAAGWSDDFNDGSATDGIPVTWSFNEVGATPGTYDASSGDYTLSNPGGGSGSVLLPSVPAAFTDVYETALTPVELDLL